MTNLTTRRLIRKRWNNMFDRCYNPRHARFADYGGRGITVCERWRKFEDFYADVGDPPEPGFSLDRIDNDGNYEPGNIRWATPRQQAMNSRSMPLIVVMDGKIRISHAETAARLGVPAKSIAKRLAKYRRKGFDKVEYADLEKLSLKFRR